MDETTWPFYLSALLTGLAFGYATQRGGFCLTRALSNLFIMGDAAILRAYGLALLVATVGVHLLLSWGLVEIPIRPFRWVANLVGGLTFGFGMILSGGCSGSTWYRTGEGAVGAWVVLLGFAMGATTTSVGALAPLRRTLQTPSLTLGEASPTVYNVVGKLFGAADLSPWTVIVPLGILLGWVLWRGAAEPEHGKWPWPLTGTVVGVVIALGWWASNFGRAPTGITFAINTSHALTYPLVGYPTRVTWSMILLLGVPVGAFIGAWHSGEFRWKLPPGWSLVKIFAGGLLMGAGGILADGCNITQGLTNSATLAVGSLVAFASMGLGAYLALWALYLRRA
ncbi:MAG: YeeE/YedE family protein [Candidatus Methylomirabilia bacterium]